MKNKIFTKQILPWILTICLLTRLIPSFSGDIIEVSAAVRQPMINAFATKDELMTEFDMNDKSKMKIWFGQRGQSWNIAGSDGKNRLVLLLAGVLDNGQLSGINLESKFHSDSNSHQYTYKKCQKYFGIYLVWQTD